MAAPPFIGLTGAVAAGKSEALAAFGRLGAETLSTDAIAHELLADAQVRERLVERWGPEVAPGGEVDRAAVGARVFASPEDLRWLEAELHPRVGERVLAWRQALPEGTSLAVVEVPLLFESGMDAVFDATVCVTAADEVRAGRAGARGTADLAGREGRQLSQEEKAGRADFVLANDGTVDDLEAAVRELWPRFAEHGRMG